MKSPTRITGRSFKAVLACLMASATITACSSVTDPEAVARDQAQAAISKLTGREKPELLFPTFALSQAGDPKLCATTDTAAGPLKVVVLLGPSPVVLSEPGFADNDDPDYAPDCPREEVLRWQRVASLEPFALTKTIRAGNDLAAALKDNTLIQPFGSAAEKAALPASIQR